MPRRTGKAARCISSCRGWRMDNAPIPFLSTVSTLPGPRHHFGTISPLSLLRTVPALPFRGNSRFCSSSGSHATQGANGALCCISPFDTRRTEKAFIFRTCWTLIHRELYHSWQPSCQVRPTLCQAGPRQRVWHHQGACTLGRSSGPRDGVGPSCVQAVLETRACARSGPTRPDVLPGGRLTAPANCGMMIVVPRYMSGACFGPHT